MGNLSKIRPSYAFHYKKQRKILNIEITKRSKRRDFFFFFWLSKRLLYFLKSRREEDQVT
jgi:hypothetical protein